MRVLSLKDREEIEKLISDGVSLRNIGKTLGFSGTCIITEIKKNGGKDKYRAREAQEAADKRHKNRGSLRRKKFSEEEKSTLLKMIENKFSPSQIRKHFKMSWFYMLELYKSCGLKPPNIYATIVDLEEKIYGLEEQLKIIFEMVNK